MQDKDEMEAGQTAAICVIAVPLSWINVQLRPVALLLEEF